MIKGKSFNIAFRVATLVASVAGKAVLSIAEGLVPSTTDYFTKWVEAAPIKEAEQKTIIRFVRENRIYRFGLPETIVTDQALCFTGAETREFAEGSKSHIHLLTLLKVMGKQNRLTRR